MESFHLRFLQVFAVLLFCSEIFKVQADNLQQSISKCNYPKDIFGVLVEKWENIDSLEDLKSSSLPKSSSPGQFIQTLDVPRDPLLESVGQRLRTYFLAPETGNYVFYLACDDSCELNLSTDEKPGNAVTLVTITSYTAYQEWSGLYSGEVTLTKGRSYFLEALLVQNTGAYHISVGVKHPDGSYSMPVGNEHLIKYEPGKYGEAPAGDWGEWSQCSATCGEGAQERHRSCQNPPPVYSRLSSTVNQTEKRFCGQTRSCSVPLSNIHVQRTSSTSLTVTWHSHWQNRWLDELRGFIVLYNKTDDSVQNVTVGASDTTVEIRDLAIFHLYCVRVLLLAVTGDGLPSSCFMSSTDQDVPSAPPSGLVARNSFSPFKIRAHWDALPQPLWQGIPRGYSLRLEVFNTAHDENHTWSGEVRVGPLSTGALVEGLQTYTTYRLQVAAFTEKGPGPYSAAILVDTCRCPRKLLVNWLEAPPLCSKTRTQNVTDPTGLLPDQLQDMVNHACFTCHGHKRTEVIYREQNTSLQEIPDALSSHVQLNLPISLSPQFPFIRSQWVFLPMVEVAGIAFLTREPSPGVYSGQLGSSLLKRWPVLVVLFVVYLTFGILIWAAECRVNPTQFPPSLMRGWKHGFWWAFVSTTTVGYGRHYPKSIAGRLVGIACLLVGVILNALFVSAVTSSLTAFTADEEANPERGSTIGVVSGSAEHQLAMRLNGSKAVTYKSYPTKDTLVKGLKSRALDGALIDILTAEPLLKDLNDSDYEVTKVVPRTFFYGIILTGNARCLLRNFTDFLSRVTIQKQPKPNIPLQDKKSNPRIAEPTESAQEMTSFFDPQNSLYQQTVKVTGAALLLLLISGVLYHLAKTWRSKKRGQEKTHRVNTEETKAEMRQLLEEFHARIQHLYTTLKHKHRRQLKELTRLKNASLVAIRTHSNSEESKV